MPCASGRAYRILQLPWIAGLSDAAGLKRSPEVLLPDRDSGIASVTLQERLPKALS